MFLFVFVFAFCTLALNADKTLVVELEDGRVEGEQVRTSDSVDLVHFKGIRYGLAPTRERRFQAPERPTRWEGVKSAKYWRRSCYQFSLFRRNTRKQVKEDEDCLFLSVTTPTACMNGECPVVAYVHGGAFGTGSLKDSFRLSQLLANNDIVIVPIQYRLGPLGFLTTSDEFAAGNWGVWDVLSALQWIKRNIKAFGGNPNDVALMGTEAGSTIVSLLTVIPQAESLFNKAIMIGSPSSGQWWTNGSTTALHSQLLAEHDALQCDLPSTMQRINCLRTTAPEHMVKAFGNLTERIIYGRNPLPFTPNTDGYLIQGDFQSMLKTGKPIPLLIITSPSDTASLFEPVQDNFNYQDLMTAFRSLINENNYKYPGLVRRLALHHYIHTEGDKKDSVFLYQQYKKIMHDVMTTLPWKDEISARLSNGWDKITHVRVHTDKRITVTDLLSKKTAYESADEQAKQLVNVLRAFVKNSPANNTIETLPLEHIRPDQQDRYMLIRPFHKPMAKTGFGRRAQSFWRVLVPDIQRIMKDYGPPLTKVSSRPSHDEL